VFAISGGALAVPVLAGAGVVGRAIRAQPALGAADPPREDRKLTPERLIVGRPQQRRREHQLRQPKVEPGKVRWHPTRAARGAAVRSGKPVLLSKIDGPLSTALC